MIKNVIVSNYKTIVQRNKEEVRKETIKLIDQGKAAKDKIDNMDKFVKNMGEKIVSIEKTVVKMGEKMDESNMVQKLDKEADSDELPDTKADTGS